MIVVSLTVRHHFHVLIRLIVRLAATGLQSVVL